MGLAPLAKRAQHQSANFLPLTKHRPACAPLRGEDSLLHAEARSPYQAFSAPGCWGKGSRCSTCQFLMPSLRPAP